MPRAAFPSSRPGSRTDPDRPSFALVTVSLLEDHKPEFDAIQGFLSGLAGRHLTQWETMEIVLQDARTNPHGRLSDVTTARATTPARPKTKLP